MKKAKLLTSLTSLGAIAAAVPIVTTSCAQTRKLDVLMVTTADMSAEVTKIALNISSSKFEGVDETVTGQSSFTYTKDLEKANKYIIATFNPSTQAVVIRRTATPVTEEQKIAVNFTAVGGNGHVGTVTIEVTVAVLATQNLTNIQYMGQSVDDLPKTFNYYYDEIMPKLNLAQFSATNQGASTTLTTLTVTSSNSKIIEADKVEGKEEYIFTIQGNGTAILNIELADGSGNKGYIDIQANVAKDVQDKTVAYIDLDDSSSVDVAVRYDSDGNVALGTLSARAYNKEDQLLPNAKLSYIIEQGNRPDWLGNIHCTDGVITAKAYPEWSGGKTVDTWKTTFKVVSDGASSAYYPLTFYFISALDQNGFIYDKLDGTYSTVNFNEPMTAEEIALLCGEDDIVINGATYKRNQIISLEICNTASVEEIPDKFCENLTKLWFLDVGDQPLTNIKKIGNLFMHNCKSLTSVDLSGFTNVTKIGAGAFSNCDNLVQVNLGTLSSTIFTADTDDMYSFATDNEDAACFITGIAMFGKYSSDVADLFPYASSWWYGVYRNIIAA